MPDVGSELLSRAKTFSLVPTLSEPSFGRVDIPSGSTPCTSSLFETSLLTFVPFYTACQHAPFLVDSLLGRNSDGEGNQGQGDLEHCE
jgi:hypothetical protein